MKQAYLGLALLVMAGCTVQTDEGSGPDAMAADRAEPKTTEDRFAILALDCVHREYPNKIAHVLQSEDDARTPSELTPAFYGCYDWHSSVHGHWLLSSCLLYTSDAADE